MNETNVLGRESAVYKKLIDTYDEYEKAGEAYGRPCYDECYKIVDDSDYYEICFIISQLKELHELGDIGVSGSLGDIVQSLLNLLTSTTNRRSRFLLGILEEARERKRK